MKHSDIEELKNEITELIDLKQEGLYWDFKEKWYTNQTRPKIVQDIICLANNTCLRNAYIIVGVSDAGNIMGVDQDPNRWNTQQLIGWFRDKANEVKFAGGIRPSLKVETLDDVKGVMLDVIIISPERHIPYYLEKEYSEVVGKKKITLLPYSIYTREQDGNTAQNSCANTKDVELLWKRRFGIEGSVYERYLLLLDQYDEWEHDFGNKNYAFHKTHPEFRIEIDEDRAFKGWEPQAALYSNQIMTIRPMNLLYHSTIVKELELVTFDEYRVYLPWGTRNAIEFIKYPELGGTPYGLHYDYYCLDDFKGKIARITSSNFINFNRQLELLPHAHIHPFLVFKDDLQRKDFEDYARIHSKSISVEEIRKDKSYIINGQFRHNKSESHSESQVLRLLIAVELYKLWKNDTQQ